MGSHDPHTTCSLYSAGQDLDPFGEEAIRAANPAFDDFMNRGELLSMAAAAKRMPSREADFRRFTLNQRIQVATPFVSAGLWESCRGQVAPLAELQVLYAGFDLSAVNDLSAFVLVGEKGGKWQSHCRFWLPQDGLADKAATDHAPYDGNANLVPVVTNGKVYVASYKTLAIFGLTTKKIGLLPLAAPQVELPLGVSQVTGTIKSASGPTVVLSTRFGTEVTVNITDAVQSQHMAASGNALTVTGSFHADGTLFAQSITRAKSSPALWPPDR